MLSEFIKHVASDTGLNQKTAKAALGIVLNAAERQGAPLADEIFERVPGARVLAANMGAQVGAATGVIARLIEQTPGGRRSVTEQMIRSLQREGLGNNEISALFPAIGAFCVIRVWRDGASAISATCSERSTPQPVECVE